MEYEDLVDCYRKKLLERYETAARQKGQQINKAELLEQICKADQQTLDAMIRLLGLGKN